MSTKHIFDLLQRVDLFSALPEEQINLLSQLAERRVFSKGEVVIREGEDGSAGLFFIDSGELEVYITSDDHKETILSLLTEGDFFGEMSLLDDEPRSASVKATGHSILYQIRRTNFLSQLQKFPELTMSLLVELSKKVRRANKQINSLATLSVYGRVASTLNHLTEERGLRIRGEHGQRVIVIPNKPTQQQIADMSGTTRETVSRILTNLKNKGVISIHGKDLIVHNLDTLKNPEEEL